MFTFTFILHKFNFNNQRIEPHHKKEDTKIRTKLQSCRPNMRNGRHLEKLKIKVMYCSFVYLSFSCFLFFVFFPNALAIVQVSGPQL